MATALSKKQTCRPHYDIEESVVYHPSEEEFRDPLKFINSIREEAEKYGICKIVPPAGWRPPHQERRQTSTARMPTKLQCINELQEGKGFEDGKQYSMTQYKVMADQYKQRWINEHHGGVDPGLKALEKDYWDVVEMCHIQTSVEYANDLDVLKFGSGFPRSWRDTAPVTGVTEDTAVGIEPPCKEGSSIFDDESYYSRTGWNLNILPHMHASLLKHLKANISGVNVPWLYVGMLFSTFCWHNEDNYLYSINYSHEGSVKQWYGVPGASTPELEKAVASANMMGFEESPDLLHHMALQVSPSFIRSQGVPVYQLAQEPGTYIITFPKSFHGGFSYGYNVGEAVNFAIPDWLKYGGEAAQRYTSIGRPSALSYDRLLCTVLHHLKDRSSLPLWAYPILAKEIDRLIANELFFRQEVIKRGIKQNPTVLPRNDFDRVCEKSTDYDELRSCLWCKQYCIFSVVICSCDNQAVMCPGHSHKKCRRNRKCSPDKKSLLVWASTAELKALKNSMHTLMKEHKSAVKKEEREREGQKTSSSRDDSGDSTNAEVAKMEVEMKADEQPMQESAKDNRVVYVVEDDSH